MSEILIRGYRGRERRIVSRSEYALNESLIINISLVAGYVVTWRNVNKMDAICHHPLSQS